MRPTRYWRSEDGVKIPHHSERNARNDWDDKYYDQLVATHAGGNSHAFKHVKIPLDANFIGHSDEPFTGARNRTGFYTRMLHGGDSVPPIAVKEAAGGYEVIDGHSRIRASKAAGKDDIGAYVLISRSNEPVMKFEGHSSIDEPVAQNPIQVKHYSLKSGLKKLHPKHQGTGLAGPEKNRSKRIPRIYLYTREGTPEAHVSGGHLYHGELPAGTQLYNMGEDPLDLMAPKWQPTEDGMMYEPADLDEVERHLYDLGYHGYHNYGVKDAIAYFHALPVQQQKSERMAKSDIGGMLSRIRLVRQTCDRRVRGAKNPTHICHMVAPAVAHTTGLHHVMGVYRGPEVDAYSEGDGNYYHEWNVHDDGTIVDATADQFGDDSVRIIPPNDPRSGWYEATTINHTPSSVVKSEAGLHHLWNPGSRDPLTVAHPHDNVVWYEYLPEDLEKGKKDGLAMYKPEHPGFPQAKDHVNWAFSKLPDNWAMMATRHHREHPEDFTPEIKAKLEDYSARSPGIEELKNHRFTKTDTLHDAMSQLADCETRYVERMKSNLKLAPMNDATKEIDFGDGTAWYSFPHSYCDEEGAAMGHCGNNSQAEIGSDRVYSMRTTHTLGGVKYYEPNLTFIRNGNVFGEMKSRGNSKPPPKYHEKIVALLNSLRAYPHGGTYLTENDFNLADLSPELLATVHPDILATHQGDSTHLHTFAREPFVGDRPAPKMFGGTKHVPSPTGRYAASWKYPVLTRYLEDGQPISPEHMIAIAKLEDGHFIPDLLKRPEVPQELLQTVIDKPIDDPSDASDLWHTLNGDNPHPMVRKRLMEIGEKHPGRFNFPSFIIQSPVTDDEISRILGNMDAWGMRGRGPNFILRNNHLTRSQYLRFGIGALSQYDPKDPAFLKAQAARDLLGNVLSHSQFQPDDIDAIPAEYDYAIPGNMCAATTITPKMWARMTPHLLTPPVDGGGRPLPPEDCPLRHFTDRKDLPLDVQKLMATKYKKYLPTYAVQRLFQNTNLDRSTYEAIAATAAKYPNPDEPLHRFFSNPSVGEDLKAKLANAWIAKRLKTKAASFGEIGMMAKYASDQSITNIIASPFRTSDVLRRTHDFLLDNPNLSEKTIHQLADRIGAMATLLQHPNANAAAWANPKITQINPNDEGWLDGQEEAIIQHNNTPEFIRKCLKSPSRHVLRTVAKNKNLTPKQQMGIVDRLYSVAPVDWVWQEDEEYALAGNPSLTPEAQTGLITKWQDPNSRIANTYNNATQLASNPALTPENQRELLDVSLEGVRHPVLEGLAANPNLDPAIGRELAASPDEDVRTQFARWAAPAQPLARSEDHTEYDTEAGLDPEFKQWFGNSKTTGFQGKPMKFYRGTAKPGMKGKLPTMSFVEHPDVASVYSATPDMDGGASIGHGATVHPVHIKMENPIYLQEHQTRFSDVLMALKYGQPNGITHDEAVKMLNHMCNRTRGVKVKLPPFQYRYSKYPWVEPHDRDPDEYEEGEEALDPDFDPEDEEFSLTQYPISRFRDAFEYEHGFENVMAEASRLKADTYAYIDTPRFAEVAKRLGHDGVIHGDVFNAKGAMNDVLDKDPDEIDGLEEERGLEDWDWTHQTYRPFDISQVRSIFHGAGKPELSRPSLVPWLNKAEALLKMAIRDVKPGTPLDPQDISLDEFTNNPVATHGYDYSHLITSPLLRHKYGMHVYPSRDGLNVRVFHKGSGRSLGSLVGMIDRHDGIKVIDPTFTHIEPELRGKGLGKAMYEAAFAHAYHHHNVRGVIGGEHSTMAHGVHQALSEKHGFEGYNPVSRIPRGDGYTGAFDDAFGDYEYRIQ